MTPITELLAVYFLETALLIFPRRSHVKYIYQSDSDFQAQQPN